MTTAIKQEIKNILGKKSTPSKIAKAKKVLRREKIKLADFRDSFKLTKSGVLSKRDEWAESLFVKVKSVKVKNPKIADKATQRDLTKIETQVLKKLEKWCKPFDITIDGEEYEVASPLDGGELREAAIAWVENHPKAKASEFAINWLAQCVNNKTNKNGEKAPAKMITVELEDHREAFEYIEFEVKDMLASDIWPGKKHLQNSDGTTSKQAFSVKLQLVTGLAKDLGLWPAKTYKAA